MSIITETGKKVYQRSRTASERFWAKVRIPYRNLNQCWEWQGSLDKSGYGLFRLDGKWPQKTHRVMWLLAHGREAERFVLHHCDNPRCVNPLHLYDGSSHDNMQDMLDRDRRPRKLSLNDVMNIRRLVAEGVGHGVLAQQFGVSQSLISIIKHRSRYFGREL